MTLDLLYYAPSATIILSVHESAPPNMKPFTVFFFGLEKIHTSIIIIFPPFECLPAGVT